MLRILRYVPKRRADLDRNVTAAFRNEERAAFGNACVFRTRLPAGSGVWHVRERDKRRQAGEARGERSQLAAR